MKSLPETISTGPAMIIAEADPTKVNEAVSQGWLHLHRPARGHPRLLTPPELVGLYVFADSIRSGSRVEAAAGIASGLIEMQQRFPDSDRLYLNHVDGIEWTAEPMRKGKALYSTCYDVKVIRALLARRYASL